MQLDQKQLPSPLVEWLRKKKSTCEFLGRFPTTGSRQFFGTGADIDFLVDISDVPAELLPLLPQHQKTYDYGDDVTIVHDPDHPLGDADFIIASKERTEEFIFATSHFCSMQRDEFVNLEVWQLLQDNKPLRIAIFRALRHAYPGSTLTH